MKFSYLIVFLLIVNHIHSQTFEEINEGVFVGVNYPSIAIANINPETTNDNEILITGGNNTGRVANIYAQDTNGDYYDATGVGSFIDAINSQAKVIFGDVDSDGDEDLLVTSEETKLYINDGFGVFTEITSPIANVTQGAIAFFDIDNDNDLDLLVTGYDQDTSNDLASVLYTNDGDGNFVEVTGTPFENVANSTISYADIDNDNDLDVLITGTTSSNQQSAKLYTNNGVGVFAEVAGTIFEEVSKGSTAFVDIDNDGDEDVFISGRDWQNQVIGKLYANNGSGVFSEIENTGIAGVQESAIAFADVDGDTDFDLMITGLENNQSSRLYVNDGAGIFTEVEGLPFDYFTRSALAFRDFDNDNDLDLIIAGYSATDGTFKTKLYENTTVLGIVDFEDITNVFVYPNPMQEEITISISEDLLATTSQLDFVLYDLLGSEVKTIRNISKKVRVNIQELKSGLYFYEIISSEKRIRSGKLIKK